MYISMDRVKEELKAGKIRIAKFSMPVGDFTDILYLVELLEPEKFTPQLKIGEVYTPSSVFAVRCINLPKNVRDINPDTDRLNSDVYKVETISTENIAQFILQCARNHEGKVEDNFIFPDEDEEVLIEKGLKIFEEFERITGILAGVEIKPSEYRITDMTQFFELIFIEVYNELIKTKDLPIDQIIDVEFKIDKTKDYVPKFYIYYKRNISCGDDKPYMEILARGLKELTREPKEFTLISATMTNRCKCENIEFLMELYTKMKFVFLINYLYGKMRQFTATVENNYKIFIY